MTRSKSKRVRTAPPKAPRIWVYWVWDALHQQRSFYFSEIRFSKELAVAAMKRERALYTIDAPMGVARFEEWRRG